MALRTEHKEVQSTINLLIKLPCVQKELLAHQGAGETSVQISTSEPQNLQNSVVADKAKSIPNLNVKSNSRTQSKKRTISPETDEETDSKRAQTESSKSLNSSPTKSSPRKPNSPKKSPRKLSAGPEKSPRGRSSGPKNSPRKSSPSPGKGSPRTSSRGRTLDRWKGERGRSGQVTGKAPPSPKVTPENGGKVQPKTLP